jgi:thiol-disulfide isomerase/thioredoxin
VTAGAWVLVGAVALALGFGTWRALTDGRFRGTHRVAGTTTGDVEEAVTTVLAGTPYADRIGERATLLQFSSAFCAPCRATRRVLTEVGADHPGVVHLEIDAEHHLDLVRRLGVLRTPTTLVLDARGEEVTRASGVPTRTQVTGALAYVDGRNGG